MLLLGHTQVENLTWIQIADLGGAYALGFVMVMASAALASCLSADRRAGGPLGVVCVMILLAAVWLYGSWRQSQLNDDPPTPSDAKNSLRVGLVQGSIDTRFDDPNPPKSTYETYLRLSLDALAAHPDLQLLVWPESMYWQYDEPFPTTLTPDSDPTRYFEAVADMGAATASMTAMTLGVPCLVGCAVFDYRDQQQQRYNSILLIGDQGTRQARYDKMHPVMFGEYIPLGDIFPWLYKLTPMGDGLAAGTDPVCFPVDELKFCPNICFENTVPHLIRRQVRALIAQGQSPDALITVTNDGWFWGSSLLDHHLACGVFRAVELRRPLLIAANTGFSAWIDRSGQVRQRGPRRAEGLVVADVVPHRGPESLYVHWGDLPATICLLVVLAAAVDAIRQRRVANTDR
jgi:apolipoprotein N-acyltransferase